MCCSEAYAATPGDSTTFSPPAPLLIPGRETAQDSSAGDKKQKARESYLLAREIEKANPGAAIVAYRTAVVLDPTLPEANYRAGLLLKSQFLEAAAQAFAAETRLNPAHVEAHRELAMVLSRLGRQERAIAELESLTVARPDDDQSWHALGFVYRNAGRPDKAEQALRRAIRIAPRRAVEHRDLGVVLAGQGRTREAHEEYERARSLDPHDPTLWFDIANLERSEGQTRRALEHYREAEKQDSSFWLGLRGQIEVLMELDRVDEVAAVFRRRLARHPEDHEARLAAVRYFFRFGKPGEALEVAHEGVRIAPLDADAHKVLGVTQAMHGEYRNALQSYKLALQRMILPSRRSEVETLIGQLRAQAPDSLQGMFHPDSLKDMGPTYRKEESP